MKTQTTTQSAVNVAYDLYVAASEVAQPLPWDLIFGDGSDDDLVEIKISPRFIAPVSGGHLQG
jgi:hypothetical protein